MENQEGEELHMKMSGFAVTMGQAVSDSPGTDAT